MKGLTERLSEFVANCDASTISEAERQKSIQILTDTFGNILSGGGTDIDAALSTYRQKFNLNLQPKREVSAMRWAALGAATDFDDVLSAMPAHPSAIILAVALVYIEELKSSGSEVIDAHIISLEVGAAIGREIGLGHYNQGFHATSSLGIFCGVACAARLLKLDRKTLQLAFGIAASMASGLNRNFGTMTKPLHSGLAARNAVTAIDLARSGLTAASDVFESKAGFLSTFGANHTGHPVQKLQLGSPWVIITPGLSLRKFACYNANQRPMQGLLDLMQRRPNIDRKLIRHVSCRMPPGAMQGSIYKKPTTGDEAKFSLHYALAAGIVDGRYSLQTFTDKAVNRAEIAEALNRIDAGEYSHCVADDVDFAIKTPGSRGFVEVEIQWEDGHTESTIVRVSPGHPSIGLSWRDLEEKFIDCAQFGGVDTDIAARCFEKVKTLRQYCNAAEVFEDLLKHNTIY